MLKYVSHFVLQILPSVVATVVGAYIVNYYIAPKNQDAPKAAALSTAAPAKDAGIVEPAAAEPSIEAKGAADKQNPEKSAFEKSSSEKTATEKPVSETKRAKAVTKAAPAVENKAGMAEKPPVADKPAVTVSIASPDAPLGTEERRDANDLARAALDRLRGPVEPPRKEAMATPNPPAAPRVQDQPRVTVASTPPQPSIQPQIQVQQQMQPLPPAVLVTAPSNTGSVAASPVDSQVRHADRARLTPPADIPAAPPLDLHAPSHQTSITDDVVSKARSVIDSVISR